MVRCNLSWALNSRHSGIPTAAGAISLATGMERVVKKSFAKLLTVPLIAGIALALAGCVYTPAYAPAPAYGYYAPAPAYYGYGPSVSFGYYGGWAPPCPLAGPPPGSPVPS